VERINNNNSSNNSYNNKYNNSYNNKLIILILGIFRLKVMIHLVLKLIKDFLMGNKI